MFASTKEAFGRLRDTSDLVRRRSSEPLVLSCEPTLTQRWLIPRLPQLQLQFPDLILHVRAAGGPVRFEQARIDLAIRRNDFQWPSEHFAELIIEEEVGPVCSPRFIKAGKRELLQQPLIHTATRPDAWERWLNATRRSAGANRKSFKFEHFYLSIEAAVAGLGIAIGPQPLVIDDLESGRLVAPYGFMANGFGYYLLSPKPIEQDKRSAALLVWLRTNLTKANPTILRQLRKISR
jgi:LysR family glycine cleavage system transcriptional activator